MSFPREFNGVVKQIQQDLSQTAVVADKKRRNTRFDGRLNTQIFMSVIKCIATVYGFA
jgi:hypothetical protein